MKIKFSKSDGTVNKRIVFTGLMLFYLLMLLALALYYGNLRRKTFTVRDSMDDIGNPGIILEGERSKQWHEGNKDPYDTGMEYDFKIINPEKKLVARRPFS